MAEYYQPWTRRTLALLAGFAVAALGWPCHAQALILTFQDKAAFLAQTEASSATGSIPNLGRIDAGTATLGSITVSLAPPSERLHIGALNNQNAHYQEPVQDWTLITPGNDIALSNSENLDLEIASPEPVYALGFEFVEPFTVGPPNSNTNDCYAACFDSTFTVALKNERGETVGTFTFNAPDDVVAFVGVWSDQAFTRVEIRETTAAINAAPTIDNEYFGEMFIGTTRLVPSFLSTFSLKGTTSGSETAQTSTADYTVKFTLAPGAILDPTAVALRLRIEPDAQAPDPCADVAIPAGCFGPSGGGFTVADPDGCGVSVVAFNAELTYAQDQTKLLQSFSATLQQVQGEWQARIVTAFTEAVERPDPCFITFTVGTHGVENRPISSSDLKWRATLP
jgi:hypothetical protein